MSRVAPNLLYLTIYNPTLRPSGPVAPDDEDAEEQAHILFYTSKERAVSRDRMLRQVGLAKALISFSDMFNADEPCNNVHSQTKRMIMVSPEPDFWIHAGIEVAKTPRVPSDKAKGKGKEKSKAEQPLLYDYHEHSVHDIAVQEDIMRGYDKFKLRHGSFASILSSLGQEALELQLERFFTVWAWSWNLEDGPEFGEHLGPAIHPMQGSLLPYLDAFASRLPDEVFAIAISPPYTIPSTRYNAASFPPALPNFLLSLLPPPQALLHVPPPTADDSTLRAASKPLPPPVPPKDAPAEPKPKHPTDAANGHKPSSSSSSFLGLPLDVKMDMPKWNWLTFGKNANAKKQPPPEQLFAVTPFNEDKGNPAHAHGQNQEGAFARAVAAARVPLDARNNFPLDTPSFERTMSSDFEVDRSALEDAMRSDRMPVPMGVVPEETPPADGQSLAETIVPGRGAAAEEEEEGVGVGVGAADMVPPPEHESTPDANSSSSLLKPSDAELDLEHSLPPTPEPEPEPEPPAEFSSTTVHLAPPDDPQATKKQRLLYLVRERLLVALIVTSDDDAAELAPLAEEAADLAGTLLAAMSDDADPSKSIDTLPSATKILQPQDRYVLSSARLALHSPEFASRSGHLYDARGLLLRASDPPGPGPILEVFSRGQNPQHWHVGRRLDNDSANTDDIQQGGEEVYMEVFRKEASLTDVDNALAGVVRRGVNVNGGGG